MRNIGLEEAQAGIKIARRNINNLRYEDGTTLMAKSKDTTLPIKVCLVKATVFPVVMYGCQSWTIKKVEC